VDWWFCGLVVSWIGGFGFAVFCGLGLCKLVLLGTLGFEDVFWVAALGFGWLDGVGII